MIQRRSPALEYFDAFLIIGLTATPSAQTFGFFQQNLVMEYPNKEAVADGVNVDSDIDCESIEAHDHFMRLFDTNKFRFTGLVDCLSDHVRPLP